MAQPQRSLKTGRRSCGYHLRVSTSRGAFDELLLNLLKQLQPPTPPPPPPPMSTSRLLDITRSSTSVYYCQRQTEEQKERGWPGKEASTTIPYQCLVQLVTWLVDWCFPPSPQLLTWTQPVNSVAQRSSIRLHLEPMPTH